MNGRLTVIYDGASLGPAKYQVSFVLLCNNSNLRLLLHRLLLLLLSILLCVLMTTVLGVMK